MVLPLRQQCNAWSPLPSVGQLIGCSLARSGRRSAETPAKARNTIAIARPAATRILFPFVGESLSTPAFDAALRIARAEGATLVPAYLAIVPLSVQLDTPLKKQAAVALPMLEAIEQRAATQGVPVDGDVRRCLSVHRS